MLIVVEFQSVAGVVLAGLGHLVAVPEAPEIRAPVGKVVGVHARRGDRLVRRRRHSRNVDRA